MIPEKHRALAHAWVDGAEIEYRQPNCGIRTFREWTTADVPAFAQSFEYRIKPKAKVKKWRWVAGHPGGTIYVVNVIGRSNTDSMNFFSEAEALQLGYLQKVDATMIEVDE